MTPVARREYVGAGGFKGDGGGFDGAAGRDGHVLRKGIEIGGLPDGEDHGIGGDGAGLRFIKRRAERAGSVLDGKAGFDGEAGNGVRAFDAHWPQPHWKSMPSSRASAILCG